MIRGATQPDLSQLASLHRDSIRVLCAQSYGPEQLAAWTAGLEPALYASLLATHAVYVCEQDSDLLGFGVCDLTASLINAVYVRPTATRLGVGRRIMAVMEARLLSHGAREVKLNATLNAVEFYERLGFERVSTGKNQLPGGVELACVVMIKGL